jgi:hypothetical protein
MIVFKAIHNSSGHCLLKGRERNAHIGDEVVEGLLLFAELNHNRQDVVVQSHGGNLANLLDVVRVHHITAHAGHHMFVSIRAEY